MQVQIANSSHVEALLALARRTFVDTYAIYNTPENLQLYLDTNFTPAIMAGELSEKGSTYLVGFEDNTIIAFAKIRTIDTILEDSEAAEIQRIYVDQSYHSKGLGSVMMQACIDYAKQQGFNKMGLGVWENNPKAIAFYTKWGFEKVGVHSFVLGSEEQNDFILMKNL